MNAKENWNKYVNSEAFEKVSAYVSDGGETICRQENYIKHAVSLSRKNLTTPFSC